MPKADSKCVVYAYFVLYTLTEGHLVLGMVEENPDLMHIEYLMIIKYVTNTP